MTLSKREDTKSERGSTRSHCVENSLWQRLWTCRKTYYRIDGRPKLFPWHFPTEKSGQFWIFHACCKPPASHSSWLTIKIIFDGEWNFEAPVHAVFATLLLLPPFRIKYSRHAVFLTQSSDSRDCIILGRYVDPKNRFLSKSVLKLTFAHLLMCWQTRQFLSDCIFCVNKKCICHYALGVFYVERPKHHIVQVAYNSLRICECV